MDIRNWYFPCLISDTAESGDPFKNAYDLLHLRALKFSHLNKMHIFQCMGEIFCVEVQREIPHKISHPYIKRYNLYAILPQYLRALRFKSLCAFLTTPSPINHPINKHRKKIIGCIIKHKHDVLITITMLFPKPFGCLGVGSWKNYHEPHEM